MHLDIDNFKRLNEEFGHTTGDAILVEVANRIRALLRSADVIARYGGEEFLALLPSTHFTGAVSVSDRLRKTVGGTPVNVDGQKISVTVSLGVGLFPGRDVRNKDELVRAAERALREAKALGPNRLCVFQHLGYIHQPGG